jgi:hypothetical protein
MKLICRIVLLMLPLSLFSEEREEFLPVRISPSIVQKSLTADWQNDGTTIFGAYRESLEERKNEASYFDTIPIPEGHLPNSVESHFLATDLEKDGIPEYIYQAAWKENDSDKLSYVFSIIIREAQAKDFYIIYYDFSKASSVRLSVNDIKNGPRLLQFNRVIEKESNLLSTMDYYAPDKYMLTKVFSYLDYKREFGGLFNCEIISDKLKLNNGFLTIVYNYNYFPNADSLSSFENLTELQNEFGANLENLNFIKSKDSISYLITDKKNYAQPIYLNEQSRKTVEFLESRSSESFANIFSSQLKLLSVDKNTWLSTLASYYMKKYALN